MHPNCPARRRHRPALARALATVATLATAATAAPSDDAAPALHLLVFPAPGLFDLLPDGRIGGPGGALVAKIGQASDVPFEIDSLPIARAVATGIAKPNSCLVGIVRTPEREALFHWVGVVSRAGLTVYGRNDETPPLAALADLHGKRVVVLRETVNAAQLHDQGIAAQEVGGTLSALRMLQARRVDYWYSYTLVAEPAASAAGGTPIKPLYVAAHVDSYLACHLNMPAPIIERLRQGLLRLRRQGDLAEFDLR